MGESYKDSRPKKLSPLPAAHIDNLHPHIPVHACQLCVWGENYFRDILFVPGWDIYVGTSCPILNLGILQLCTIGNPGTLSLVNFSQSVTKPENSVIGWNETIRASQSILKPFVGHIFWQVENVMQLFWKWEKYKILAPARNPSKLRPALPTAQIIAPICRYQLIFNLLCQVFDQKVLERMDS